MWTGVRTLCGQESGPHVDRSKNLMWTGVRTSCGAACAVDARDWISGERD